MFNKFIKTQHVCISISELFDWWDKLDKNPDKAYELFTSFLESAEDTLEMDPSYYESLKNLNREDFVPLCEEELKQNIKDLKDSLDNNNGQYDIKINPKMFYNPYNWKIRKIL